MKYRHEYKQQISRSDMLAVKQRLSVVCKKDCYTTGGRYFIRSLYFDNAEDKALREKLDGINLREKFRLRFYNGDTSFIRLEKKSKINGLCLKEGVPVTKEQAMAIVGGNSEKRKKETSPLIKELYFKMQTQGLKPKVITDYTREPFVFAAGNVRITIDYDIRAGTQCKRFLEAKAVTVPVINSPIILEVKYDEFLPDVIRDIIQLEGGCGSFSKYAACRSYG